MAADASKSTSSADSYIGSLISLTSKSEIRYEGVLYSINTEESSIGLRNVRSFGSEGRKKDGPQIPPSDRVYEFILFRGTDIKDLQVKSTPPVQPASTVDNDPAIIQSHYPRPSAPATSFPSAVTVPPTDVNSHMGHPGSNFPAGMPLYHPGASLGSWNPSPPPSMNGNPLPMPYWPGMYGPPNALPPHLHQHPFLRPPPGLSVPPSLQHPMPYPGLSAQPQAAPLNEASSSSLPTTSSSSATIGFNPPPLAGSLNVPSSSPPLLGANSSSTAVSSSPLLPFSLAGVPSLQQPMIYSGFSAPGQTASLNVPNSSSMMFTTNGSSPFLGFNPSPPAGSLNLPSSTSPLLVVSSSSLTTSALPSLSLPVVPSLNVTSESPASSVFNMGLNSGLTSEAINAGLPKLASLTISDYETTSINPPVTSKVNTVISSTLPYQSLSQPATSVLSSSAPSEKEVLVHSLVTPDQLLQPGQSQISSQSSQNAHKDVEVAQVSSSSEQSVSVTKEKEAQPPILPLPSAPRPYHKPNGAPPVRHNYRGSGRGRGTGGSRPVARFTEDFDFTAMNEKFNKDEVWDHLGKSSKNHSKEGDEDDSDAYEDEDGAEPKAEVKAVYNKDDFFDSLSSNVLDNESRNARPRFSEQRKIDTETFGEFARYRGGRGGRGPGRGGYGGGGRGSNYGRGGYGYARGSGRGYGNAGRGRGGGRSISSQAS